MNNLKTIQLDLFGDDREIRLSNKVKSLESDINEIGASSDRVRRGIFARHNEIMKIVRSLEDRMAIIEKHICKPEMPRHTGLTEETLF